MKKICFAVLTANLAISLIVLFTSCNEEAIQQTVNHFDPPRFTWRSFEIPGDGIAGIWAKDTSDVFWINPRQKTLYHLNKGTIQAHYYGNYNANEILGVSNNEVYLFASSIEVNHVLVILKWNGSGFEKIRTNVPSDLYPFTIRGCLDNASGVWVSSEFGAFRYDGINTNSYFYENPDLVLQDMYLSDEGKIRIVTTGSNTGTDVRQCLFEFSDTGFVKIYDRSSGPPSIDIFTQINGFTAGIHNDMNSFGNCLMNFDGEQFSVYNCFNDQLFIIHSQPDLFAGTSFNNFLTIAEVKTSEIFVPGSKKGIIFWDGNKPSAELGISLGLNEIYANPKILYINNDSYIVLETASANNAFNAVLYFGHRK